MKIITTLAMEIRKKRGMKVEQKCALCGSLTCDRCGGAMHHSYSWSDCTEEFTCSDCDRRFYSYYAGCPNYEGGSLQKLWFVLMERFWMGAITFE